ncbi:SDR family oxidoreductase [Streptomyces sp. NA02950]|uniref:SDR family oxidoreductase n=1 Tax=Streptomyces sp. NA02950 TaxID=2742137 RepID=UPI001590826B|nr:SDR family oxidoreductase [Streptomyces sp. NA02950]QKV96572.1 SDR family oxidoreductase [Streptomyces sp. NA02950]
MAAVLITGCGSGIGLETALRFAGRGDHTYATLRNPAKAARLKERAAAVGAEVEVLALDVTDDTSVTTAVRTVEERHGAVDVLVNNAGIDVTGPVEAMPLEWARTLMETNFWGPLRTIRAVLPAMRARGAGVIVNVSSAAGRVPSVPYGGFYAASKSGLGALSEALSGEVARFGVRVVCLEPGSFATEVHTRPATREAVADDPYAADEAWLTRFLAGVGEAAGDPGVVADAIVGAVENPATPLHLPVGRDAEMAVEFLGTVGFEEWLPQFVARAETIAGPRP